MKCIAVRFESYRNISVTFCNAAATLSDLSRITYHLVLSETPTAPLLASKDETDASCARTGPPFGDVAEAGNGNEPIP